MVNLPLAVKLRDFVKELGVAFAVHDLPIGINLFLPNIIRKHPEAESL